MVHNGRGGGITVDVLEIGLASFGPLVPRGMVGSSTGLRLVSMARASGGLGSEPYVLDHRATPEGLVLSAGTTGERPQRAVTWVGRSGRPLVWRDTVRADRTVVQVRRHPPSRVGRTLVIPTDAGAMLVPLTVPE